MICPQVLVECIHLSYVAPTTELQVTDGSTVEKGTKVD